MATEHREKPEDDTSARQDRETYRESTDAYTTVGQSVSIVHFKFSSLTQDRVHRRCCEEVNIDSTRL